MENEKNKFLKELYGIEPDIENYSTVIYEEYQIYLNEEEKCFYERFDEFADLETESKMPEQSIIVYNQYRIIKNKKIKYAYNGVINLIN